MHLTRRVCQSALLAVFVSLCLLRWSAMHASAQDAVIVAPTTATVIANSDIDRTGFTFSAFAISPDGKKGYAGYYSLYDTRRLGLAAFNLAGGEIVGEPSRYKNSPLPRPKNSNNTVTSITTIGRYRKLYLTHTLSAAVTHENRLLTVYDLDKDGEPIG